jgi:hypothetical protein
MTYVLLAALLIGALTGFYGGWLCGRDHAESRQLARRADTAERIVAGRRARSWPLRTTGELAAMYERPYPE